MKVLSVAAICVYSGEAKAHSDPEHKWAVISRQSGIQQAHIDLSLTKLMSVDMRQGVSPQRHQSTAVKTGLL